MLQSLFVMRSVLAVLEQEPFPSAAVWGWTEQKNEALGLVRAAIHALSGQLAGTAGYERRQLIAAAHTTIVVAAFFESFREHAGKESFKLLQITDDEKEMLITGRLRRP